MTVRQALSKVHRQFMPVPPDLPLKEMDRLITGSRQSGATKAAAIVAYRDANGPFKNVQELTQVKGIGQSILDKNRNRLVVE